MTTYKNPWHTPGKPHYGPAVFSTNAKGVRVGKYVRYHVIVGRGYNQHDYVIDGVCVTQRGGIVDEQFLDNDWHTQDNIQRFGSDAAHARCDESAQSSDPISCGNTAIAAA